MDLADLYHKHDQDIENFKALRDKTWGDLKKRHNEIIGAFGSKENLPDGYEKKMQQEVEDFQRNWSIETGTKYKDMKKQHKEQIKSITKKAGEQVKTVKTKAIKEAKSEQAAAQKKKAQMVKQQKAMMAKIKQQQKPKQ